MPVRVGVNRQLIIESTEFKNLKKESESLRNFRLVQNNQAQSFVKQIDQKLMMTPG